MVGFVRNDLERLLRGSEGRTWVRPAGVPTLVILFTPRSGSSWFGGLLTKTGSLGFPEEYINVECIEDANRDLSAASEYDFLCGCLASRVTRNRFFSIQATWGDISRLETVDFFEFFSSSFYVWLRRLDVVDQAISLLIATETGVFHQRLGEQRRPADFQNNAKLGLKSAEELDNKIVKWISHIVHYECSTEIQLNMRAISPMRIFYEDLVKTPDMHVDATLAMCGVGRGEPAESLDILKNDSSMKAELRMSFIRRNRATWNALQSCRPPIRY
jgi:LPS sulfotransferase NodH